MRYRNQVNAEDRFALKALEVAASDVTTLTDGVTRDELFQARLTRREVQARLLEAAAAVNALSREARDCLAELDYTAWQETTRLLGAGGPAGDEGLWFAVSELVPLTLNWLQAYRAEQPEWFAN